MSRARVARLLLAVVVVFAVAAFKGSAFADGGAAGPAPVKAKPPPKYELLRYREDWSALLCVPPCERPDLSDRIKAVPVAGDGCWWANFGGQVRVRCESFQNFAFGAIADDDDSWFLSRVRLHADLHAGEHLRAYVEGIYADQDERTAGPRAIDENHGDLLDAFVEAFGRVGPATEAGVRLGRFEMNYGKQRVIGAFDWANTRRTYEGVGAWAKTASRRLDGWVTRPVVVDADEFDERDDDALFAGLYYADASCPDLKWDAYLLHLARDRATWLGVADDETRWTVGLRGDGPFRGTRFDWDAEAAYQLGRFGGETISAGMVTAEVGWKPCGTCFEPRIALGADWASGDDGAGGGLGTYDQLFPTGHLWFGYADFVGRQNVTAARLTATAKPGPKWTVRADLHRFWRSSEDDAAYNAGGGVLRAPAGSGERDLATEVDLTIKFSPDRHWDLEAGWARAFAGSFLEETGAHGDVDFLWLSAAFTF